MEKLATNVDEQIAKLESRGMTIGDKNKAKECLLDIGYFRLEGTDEAVFRGSPFLNSEWTQ